MLQASQPSPEQHAEAHGQHESKPAETLAQQAR